MEKILKVFNARQMVGKFAKCAMLAACFGMMMGMSGVASAADPTPTRVEVRNKNGVLLGYLPASGDFKRVDPEKDIVPLLELADDITVRNTLNVTSMATFNGGIDAKGNKIVNVGAGDITSATSTDAVNGGQLYTMTNVESAGNYIAVGTSVASNLAALDIQVKANADAIANIGPGSGGIAVGDKAKENAKVGYGNEVSGQNSTAVGSGNTVTGTNSTAVGSKNIVAGNRSGAFGDPNNVNGNGSFAFGNDNTINADNAFALGNNATVSANSSVAIGEHAEATHANSVALGAGSVTDRADSVAVGNRQITGVKDGTAPTDAVNKKQLDEVNAKTMGQISATNDRVNRVGATAAALAAINYQPMSKGQSQVAVGMGSYKGKKATALGVAYQISDRVSGAVAGAANGSEHMVNVGFNYLFGQHSNKDVAQMAATPGSMSLKEAELQAEVDSLKNEIAELKAMVKALAAK